MQWMYIEVRRPPAGPVSFAHTFVDADDEESAYSRGYSELRRSDEEMMWEFLNDYVVNLNIRESIIERTGRPTRIKIPAGAGRGSREFPSNRA